MHSRIPIPPTLIGLIQHQSGAVSRLQALAHGLTRAAIDRLLRNGEWIVLARGVYQGHSGQPSWSCLAWAGVLIGGADAVLAGRAAAALHGLLDDQPRPIQVLVPHDRRASQPSETWRFTRTRTTYRSLGTPPRTTVERTVIDLSTDLGQAVDLVTKAVGARKTTSERLLRELGRHQRVGDRLQMLALLEDVAEGTHSPLELNYLRNVERAHGLPKGRRQDRAGSYLRDVYYDAGLVVELDGRKGHEGLDAFRDMDRDNYHAIRGTPSLRFGHLHCQPVAACETARMVAAMLQQLGWAGRPTNCRRCQAQAA